MRRRWDERARKDAFHYVASWRKGWTPEEFLRSGEESYRLFVDPLLSRLGLEPAGSSMLEVGCGAGRMTGSFAGRFARVYAVDVSGEMLRRARGAHEGAGNVLWALAEGGDLAMFRDGSLDFVFSYIVLQHLPTETLALGYIREMLRVLRTGGAYVFQFNSEPRGRSMNWKGRMRVRTTQALDRPVMGLRLDGLARLLGAGEGDDPLTLDRTWLGAVLDPRAVLAAVWESGGSVLGMSGWGSRTTWCWGKREASSPDPS
jgi:SAM-dependent methyltransferase